MSQDSFCPSKCSSSRFHIIREAALCRKQSRTTFDIEIEPCKPCCFIDAPNHKQKALSDGWDELISKIDTSKRHVFHISRFPHCQQPNKTKDDLIDGFLEKL